MWQIRPPPIAHALIMPKTYMSSQVKRSSKCFQCELRSDKMIKLVSANNETLKDIRYYILLRSHKKKARVCSWWLFCMCTPYKVCSLRTKPCLKKSRIWNESKELRIWTIIDNYWLLYHSQEHTVFNICHHAQKESIIYSFISFIILVVY